MESLTLDLFEPGMGPLHRAGLGGLACTLHCLDWPRDDWEIDAEGRRLSLHWEGGPSGARPFFERLYNRAFDLRQGMIYLPGAYGHQELCPGIRAELQRGISLTILQFGPNRKARSRAPVAVKYDDGEHVLTVEHQDLLDYTHRSAWKDHVNSRKELKDTVEVAGTTAPGFVQRHVVHSSTKVQQPPGHALALHFSLVGTLSLALGHRSSGVLIIPDVRNLHDFIRRRPMMNPSRASDCHIISPADAALQAQVRLQAAESGQSARVEKCGAVLFSSTMWNRNQKGRTAVLEVDPKATELDLFSKVMTFAALRPRLIETKPEKKGDLPRKFWTGGIVRSLIAENLARHRRWFHDFRKLVVGPDGKDDAQKVRQLDFEKEGLQLMVEQPWEDRGEETLVHAVHQAMYQCFGKIRKESGRDETTFRNRRKRQMERWRLALAQAKTADDVRSALSEIWSRAGQVSILRDSWRELLPIFCDERRWQINRDLALLALSSYKSPKKRDGAPDKSKTFEA